MAFWNKNKTEVRQRVEPKVEGAAVDAKTVMDLPSLSEAEIKSIQNTLEKRVVQKRAPAIYGVAMDSCDLNYKADYGAVNMRALGFLAGSSSFIGYQNMAFLAQHWLILKGCSLEALDAVKNGYEISVNDETALDAKTIKAIEKMDKKYKLKKNMIEGVHFNNVFGIRHILFKHTNPNFDYSLPYNPDSWRSGEYAGMSQIDPYWIFPEIDARDLQDPTRIDFYEPTYWNINGKKYHKSHFVILRGDDVADYLKPTYQYGGISKVQKVYERVYAAERTANEAPELTMTKRLVTRVMDLAKAAANPNKFISAVRDMSTYRTNYGVNVIGKGETINQMETSLSDLDEVIMGQYQLVCSTFGIPSTKLMGKSSSGFSTGETDEDYYISNVEQIQGNAMSEIANAHHERLVRTEIMPRFRVEPEIELNWNPLKIMSAKEIADVNFVNAQADNILYAIGSIDGIDIANRLIADPQSGYSGIEAPEVDDSEHGDFGDEDGAQEDQ